MRIIKLEGEDKSILIAVLETVQSGMDIGEIRRAIRLIDKLEAAGSALPLEDAEYEYLKSRFDSTKFARVSRELVALADRIEEAAISEVV